LLLLKLEPYIMNESLDQAAFLETIPNRSLSIAIAGSSALSLFLELAVIRWQGSIFEFFAFLQKLRAPCLLRRSWPWLCFVTQ